MAGIIGIPLIAPISHEPLHQVQDPDDVVWQALERALGRSEDVGPPRGYRARQEVLESFPPPRVLWTRSY